MHIPLLVCATSHMICVDGARLGQSVQCNKQKGQEWESSGDGDEKRFRCLLQLTAQSKCPEQNTEPHPAGSWRQVKSILHITSSSFLLFFKLLFFSFSLFPSSRTSASTLHSKPLFEPNETHHGCRILFRQPGCIPQLGGSFTLIDFRQRPLESVVF